ncbi:MAG: sensor histidine kinase [Candidatus Scalindua sp.]
MKTFNNKSVHRILAARLATVGIIISLVLGVTVLLVERSKIGEIVLDSALQGAVLFNAQAGYLLDQPGLPDHEEIQRELDIFVSRGSKLSESRFARVGHIVFVNLFGLDRNDVAKYIDRNHANIKTVETYMSTSKLPLPHNNMDRYEINMIKGVPYIMFCVPLTNSRGVVVAHAEGVFAVSSEEIADIERRALKTALITIAIVFVTTGLIYPVIIRQMGELKSTQFQLIHAEKFESIGCLAAGIAHEVKNPLAVIQLGIDYLSQTLKVNSGVTKTINDMDGAVKRADAVIKELLEFSRPTALNIKPLNLNAILEESLLLVKYELSRNNISLNTQLDNELPEAELDRNKMTQVFINLFMNAVHAMDKDGTLTVKTSSNQLSKELYNLHCRHTKHFKRGDRVVIVTIEDTGTGIPEDKIDKLFDPFFTTSSTGIGTGLGLSVTKNIIDLHKAAINITNRKAGGASASIIIKIS